MLQWFVSSRLALLRVPCLAAVALISLVSLPATAQDTPSIPLGSLAKRLGTVKPATGKAASAVTSTKFKPSGGRILVRKLADSLGDTDGEKKTLTDLFENALANFDAEMKKAGMPNDVAPAVALFVQSHWMIYTGKDVSDATSDKLVGQVRAILDSPEMAKASDAEKQAFAEYCVCISTLTLTLYQTATEAKNADQIAAVRATAGKSLKGLLGVEPEQIAITDKGLEVRGAVASAATAPGAASPGAAKVTYATPPDSRTEVLGGTTIIHRPKYDGYTKNENEHYYFAVLPTIPAASKPDREAAFEESWKAVTDNLKVTWPGRTMIHRFYMPSGAVCYVAMAGYHANDTFGGYGENDGARMTLCLLDFGSYYVPVAQVYNWQKGRDNLFRIQGAFDTFVASVRVAGATAPRPIASRAQLIGAWTRTDGFYGSTDYYNSSTGAYAGNVTNVSSSRESITLSADGTVKYEFFWYLNGRIQTEVWTGRWTYERGKVLLTNPKTGKTREYTLMYAGKHPKTGEPFVVLHYRYSAQPLTPLSAQSDDSKVYVPLKPK